MVTPSLELPAPTIMAIDSVNQPDAFDLYRDAATGLFDAFSEAPHFFCRTESYNLDIAVLSRFESAAQTLVRNDRQARKSDVDHVHLNIDLTGSWCGDYDGASVKGGPGTLRISNLARPFANYSSNFATLNLVISRAALGPSWADRNIHGLVMTDRSPGVRLLLAHMHQFWASIGTMTGEDAIAATIAAGTLMDGVLTGRLGGGPSDRAAIKQTLLAAARAYIDRNLAGADLSPDTIAAYLGTSRRTVYRMFREIGGVAAYVQERRLDRAFDVISNLSRDAGSLADLAYTLGFSSAAHFTRAFRARFGVTPGDVRGIGQFLSDRPRAAQGYPNRIVDWLRRMP